MPHSNTKSQLAAAMPRNPYILMTENLQRKSINDAALKNVMSRRGVATAACVCLGLPGNVNQARLLPSENDIDTRVLPVTDVKMFPKNARGINRFKELTQDVSKFTPEEQK